MSMSMKRALRAMVVCCALLGVQIAIAKSDNANNSDKSQGQANGQSAAVAGETSAQSSQGGIEKYKLTIGDNVAAEGAFVSHRALALAKNLLGWVKKVENKKEYKEEGVLRVPMPTSYFEKHNLTVRHLRRFIMLAEGQVPVASLAVEEFMFHIRLAHYFGAFAYNTGHRPSRDLLQELCTELTARIAHL